MALLFSRFLFLIFYHLLYENVSVVLLVHHLLYNLLLF